MTTPQTALEFGQHLAKLVTPKDISGYWRILSDNEKFIAHEVEAHVQQRCAALVEALSDISAHYTNAEGVRQIPDWESRDRLLENYHECLEIATAALAQFKGEV